MQAIADRQISVLAARIAAQTAPRTSMFTAATLGPSATPLNIANQLTDASAYQLLSKTAANWVLQTLSVRTSTDASSAAIVIAKGPRDIPLRALTNALQDALMKPATRALLETAFARLSAQLPLVAERIATLHSPAPQEHPIAAWLTPTSEHRVTRKRQRARRAQQRGMSDTEQSAQDDAQQREPASHKDTSLEMLVDLAQWLHQASYPDEYSDLFAPTAASKPAQFSERA
ncbi:MAG: hypothetical protein AAF004_04065 [Pseudomonadota bacterium]